MWRNVLTYQVVLFEKVMPMKIYTKNAECTSFDSRKQPQIMTNSLTAWWTSSSNSWATNIFVRFLGKWKHVSTCSSTLFFFARIVYGYCNVFKEVYIHRISYSPPFFSSSPHFLFNKHHQRAFKNRTTKMSTLKNMLKKHIGRAESWKHSDVDPSSSACYFSGHGFTPTLTGHVSGQME